MSDRVAIATLFRGTAMHNTLRVDGANQAETATPFSWKRLTQSKVERWIQGQNFDLLVASHDGYQRGEPPVIHRRWVVVIEEWNVPGPRRSRRAGPSISSIFPGIWGRTCSWLGRECFA